MLDRNLRRFLSKSGQLYYFHNLAETQADKFDQKLREHARQMLVVRLQDYWAGFVRELIVCSASGRAKSLSGTPIPGTMNFQSVRDVRIWLSENQQPRRGIDWHVSENAVQWSKKLGISNRLNVDAALGSTNSPEKQVRAYRNYIVHRSRETAERLNKDNRSNLREPRTLADTPWLFCKGGDTVFASWVKDFQIVARLASK